MIKRFRTRGCLFCILIFFSSALVGSGKTTQAIEKNRDKPNFIIVFVDDMGYGDLGCYGSVKNHTPNIDQMASQGMKFTDFYSACSVCTPSRASLLTGCYPRRVNLHVDEKGLCMLQPASPKGLHPQEITLAEVLKPLGYQTACIGKWHLGDQPDFLPTRQGFDTYFGIPYSNDMFDENILLVLMRNEKVIESPVNQDTLSLRYTREAIQFIQKYKNQPFFLYLPHSMVHVPLHASKQFQGKSSNGLYGDAIEEIDWSMGQIFKTLKKMGLDENTLVIFTSDNGAEGNNGGSNAPLRGNKGTTWEGGMRVPCLMYWPGHIPAGRVTKTICTTLDLMPTLALLAGTHAPSDRIIDGKNIWPIMSGKIDAESPQKAFYYYQIDQLQAVRSGQWKLHLPLKTKKKNWGSPESNVPLQLYNLETDLSEQKNASEDYPQVVKKMLQLAESARQDLGDLGLEGENQRPAGWIKDPKLLKLTKSKEKR